MCSVSDAAGNLVSRAVFGVAEAVGLWWWSCGRERPCDRRPPLPVGEKGPEIFVPNSSGRIETNEVLNSLSKSGGLAVTVDASSIEETGKTAKTAGTIITASLDTTFKPIIDTTSIDAALGKVSALKTAIGALGQGGGAGGSEAGLGGTGEAGGPGAGSKGALGAAAKAGARAAARLSAPART